MLPDMYRFAMSTSYRYTRVCLQVTVSKARQPAFNGIYRDQGCVCNDRHEYQKANGARIFYDDAADAWWLTMSADVRGIAYVRESDNDDIVPPNGEWRCLSGSGTCHVKAKYYTLTVYRHGFIAVHRQ